MSRAELGGDPALVAIDEIIHDLDVGDGKFERPEAPALGAMLSGVCASTDDDLQRIASAGDALDQFHAYFSTRKDRAMTIAATETADSAIATRSAKP